MSLENPEKHTPEEIKKINKTLKRVEDLRKTDEEDENSIYDLAEKEDSFRNKLLKKSLAGKDANELANDFSDETLEKIEAQKKVRQAEQAVFIDHLTGLYNKGAIIGELPIVLSLMQRKGETSSFLMLDIDHFKEINDTFGHPTGDQILKSVANLIKNEAVRVSDWTFRYGGEEFLVFLPAEKLDEAKEVAEKIRKKIESEIFKIKVNGGIEKIKVTVSIGCSDTSKMEKNKLSEIIEDAISEADQALYQSKRDGRNRVTLFNKIEQ